ncbi:hypothetical protein Tco_0981074, partial [Tanacetum coccineum]
MSLFSCIVKAVGESVEKPLMYYDNDIVGTLTLLEVMNVYMDARRLELDIEENIDYNDL